MSSIKCPSCGLINFESSSSCKRCKQSFSQLPLEGLRFEQDSKSSQSSGPVYLPNPLYQKPDQSNGKLYGKIIGGLLIAVGLLLGLATAITENYFYLPFAAGALLIGAFVTVILSQNVNRVSNPFVWGKAIGIGTLCTLLGGMYVYQDGLLSFKALVPLFGIALIVIGIVAYRRAKRPRVFEEAKHSAERLAEDEEIASPLQLKITGAYAGAIGLGCVIWGEGWAINGIPLRYFGGAMLAMGILFLTFSNSYRLRRSIPRIAWRRA